MSADSDNMLARLQVQLAQSQNQGPNLYGLTAVADPNQQAQLLSRLQNQNYVNSVGNANTDDLTSILANAGKKDFARLGQGIAGDLGLGQPQQYDTSASQGQVQAIQAGNAGVNTDLSNGVDPEQAKINALTKAAQAGVPGAADLLDKAVDARQKNQTAVQQAFKDNAQGQSALDEIKNRAVQAAQAASTADRETKKSTWTTVSGNPADPSDTRPIVQVSGTGQVEIKQKANASQAMAANVSPGAMGAMLDSYHTTGTVPGGLARSPALAGKFWEAEADYQKQNGSTAGTVLAQKEAAKSYGSALANTQKQLSATTSYVNTFDKNTQQVLALSKGLDLSDVGKVNQAYTSWLKGTSDPAYAKYNLFFNAAANEFAKIQSGSLGNTPVSDSARHEAGGVMNQYIGPTGVQGLVDGMRQESQNRISSLTDERNSLVTKLSGKAGTPQAAGVVPTPTAPPAPGAAPPTVVEFGALK